VITPAMAKELNFIEWRKMITLYYKIWADLILRATSIPANKKNWKIPSMVFMTISMTFNLLLFMTILQKHILNNYFYKIHFDFLPERLENFASFTILFVFPPAILNYLFILRKNRYKKIIKKHQYHNGKFFLAYFLTSMLLPLILLLLGIISNHIGIIH
jgi:O-antigen ligase